MQYPPQHLLIKDLLECLGRLQDGIGIGVFSLQIGDDFGVFLVAKPGVMVDAAVAMQNMLHGFAPGDGWLWNCIRGSLARKHWRGRVSFGVHKPL